ncbi:MAG: hypothetical protein HYY87_02160 [Candidatus Levybacteria bacterium]|nr:hypothetical protein [Candidatus Levybacteria bacterium]MBI2622776.1 hypothetical protein [Candidatus Levybacteria bacterium]MBI3070085.1 hypothetical protein [Candidatus Levybacteria bacterium]MBI3093202.1 hypothetical protein [Candidatus Levybacteria bacterium]
MDPKNQLSGLDPKLKEAYERVMGTTIPLASAPLSGASADKPASPLASPEPQQGEPASPPPQQPPTQEPTPPPAAIPQSPEPSPLSQQPEPQPPPVQTTEPTPNPQEVHIATGFVANAAKKEKMGGGLKISRPIFMALGVTFLVLYVFFWIRVFNLSLF